MAYAEGPVERASRHIHETKGNDMSGYNADAMRDMEKHLAGLTAAVAIVREELDGARGHFERLVAEADRHKARVAELEAQNMMLRANMEGEDDASTPSGFPTW